MKKNIWVLSDNKTVLFEVQNVLNSNGGMRALCIPSFDAAVRMVERMIVSGDELRPSLLLADYDSCRHDDYKSLHFLADHEAFAGIPLFFMCDRDSEEVEEECYEEGGMVVLRKPLSQSSISRIENASWKQEMTRNYEKFIQKQNMELQSAKEIKTLNAKLEERNKVLKQVFGKYFSESIVNVILESPGGSELGGERADVVVLMADLRGFTSLSDTLPGEVIVDMVDHFLGEMTRIINECRGTIIEFLGDAVLAVFGFPYALKMPEENALIAAIKMQNQMKSINSYNIEHEYPVIEMGVAIHKGDVFIGNIGSEYMMRYNVIGQAVNVCSRIQSYSFGEQVLVSEKSIKNIRDMVSVRDSFDIAVKGVRGNIHVCEVIKYYGDVLYKVEESSGDYLRDVKGNISALIYRTFDKTVEDYAIAGQVLMASPREIVISASAKAINDLAPHMDVELFVLGETAYAKYIGMSFGELTFRFTYVPKSFLERIGVTDEKL